MFIFIDKLNPLKCIDMTNMFGLASVSIYACFKGLSLCKVFSLFWLFLVLIQKDLYYFVLVSFIVRVYSLSSPFHWVKCIYSLLKATRKLFLLPNLIALFFSEFAFVFLNMLKFYCLIGQLWRILFGSQLLCMWAYSIFHHLSLSSMLY